jgi:DNA-binding phage protein
MRMIIPKFSRLILVCFFLASTLTALNMAFGQVSVETKTYVVIGAATVYGGNVSAAREKAISNSLVTAVALMINDLLQIDSLVGNFPQINQLLLDRTKTFVQDYKVLTEAARGKSYRVAVKATVSGEKIARQLSDAGILRTKTTLPRVLFLVAEKNVREPLPIYWWSAEDANFVSISEAVMADHLKEGGFEIIDHRGAREKPLVNWNVFDKPTLTDQEAAKLGAGLKADVVVLATSTANLSTNVMGTDTRSFNGTVAARVVRTNSAELMFDLTRTAVAANANDILGGKEALANVGDLAGQELAEQLVVVWQRQAGRPAVIEISILGTGNLSSYVKFRKALNSISGVEGIRVKEIKPNEATLLVEYKGKAKDLAAAMMLQNFKAFGINISEVTDNSIRIELIKG